MYQKNFRWPCRFVVTVFLFSLLALLAGGCATGLQTTGSSHVCISQGWPQDASDLQPDPAIRFGTLENGVRYVIRKNMEPKDRVALYLDVQSGSMQETEQQRGLAHFLEHMLFNGTTHYPPGKLIDYFQSIGMSFGADTNAHTSYDETVYKLLLPSGDTEALEEGMLVLADYARGALLLESEVDRERGVILAEKRTRDTASSRVARRSLEHRFAGTIIARRDPIGTDEVLNRADSALLRSYYDTWYRPDNLVVVLVGDMNPARAEQVVKKYFAGLRAATPEPACIDFGRVSEESAPSILYQYEPDLGQTRVELSAVWNVSPAADTVAWEKVQLENYVTVALLENRINHLVDLDDSPFSSARVYGGLFVQRLGYAMLLGSVKEGAWQQGLRLLSTMVRQGLRDGFSEDELNRVKRELRAELDRDARTAATRDSSGLASEIIGKINNNEVVLSPEQAKELYGRLLDRLTLEDVHRTMRRIWMNTGHVIEVAGTVDLRGGEIPPEQQIRQVWEEAQNQEVGPWIQDNSAVFPYLEPKGPPAAIQSVREYPRIAARTVLLDNGVRINIKKTDFEKGMVRLAVHFGDGQLSTPAPGLDKLAAAVVRESGLGRLTREQLEAALAGRNGEVRFSVGPESFVFSGKGLNEELELMLQLVYTGLVDPAFRRDGYERSMERFKQMYAGMESSVPGMYELRGDRFFAGGNPRYGFPERDEFMRLTLAQVRDWLKQAFADSRLEVSLVGDIDVDRAVALVRKYLGTLRGETGSEQHIVPAVFPENKRKIIEVSTSDDKAILAVAWPTEDFWDISRTRRLSILASVLEDRLRKIIREELGATYSPVVYNLSSRVDSGYGVLRCLLTLAPDQVDQVRKRIMEIVADLIARGVGKEELHRIVAPVLTSIRDMQRTNEYWLRSVLELSGRHPEQLDWPTTIVDDFAGVSREDMDRFAKKYLQPEKTATLIVQPAGGQKAE